MPLPAIGWKGTWHNFRLKMAYSHLPNTPNATHNESNEKQNKPSNQTKHIFLSTNHKVMHKCQKYSESNYPNYNLLIHTQFII